MSMRKEIFFTFVSENFVRLYEGREGEVHGWALYWGSARALQSARRILLVVSIVSSIFICNFYKIKTQIEKQNIWPGTESFFLQLFSTKLKSKKELRSSESCRIHWTNINVVGRQDY